MDLQPGAQLPDVQIVVTDRVTEVSGQVTDDQGRQTNEYSVIVFPIDVEQRRSNSRFISVARPDQSGRFSAEGLPAGDYVAVAVSLFEQGAQYDPQFLEPLQSRGVRFHLDEAEHRTMTLKRTTIE